jgi:hypothetical protein
MIVFRRLGLRIDRRWERVDYDEARFPGIAAAELAAAQIDLLTTVPEIADWVLKSRELPAQLDLEGRFGQPPITVFSAGRFLIQVLLWVDDLMAIHQHSFSGAFLQLAGCGLHIMYRFERHREVNRRLWLGDILRERVELLRPGDVRPITASLAHANFHLDRPTATVVIRTYNDPPYRPDFYYRPPHVAFDPFSTNVTLVRKLQVLKFLLNIDPDAHDRSAAKLLGKTDLHTALLLLEQAAASIDDRRLEGLLTAARARHGDAVNLITRVLCERGRQRALQRARSAIEDTDLRLLLALMMALGDRAAILDMVGKYYPGTDPVSVIDRWLERMLPPDRRYLHLSDEPLPSIAAGHMVVAGLLTPLFRPE